MVILENGVYQNMSVVVGLCSSNFCLLMADKRLVKFENYTQSTPIVVSDNFSKIVKVNNNVAYGMTGILFPNEPITSAIENIPNIATAFVDDVANATIEFLNQRRFILTLPRNYFIGGKNTDGTFCLYTLNINSNTYSINKERYSFQKQSSGIQSVLSIPPALSNEYSQYMNILEYNIVQSKNIEEIINRVHQFISSIADKDISVNKKCDGILIN